MSDQRRPATEVLAETADRLQRAVDVATDPAQRRQGVALVALLRAEHDAAEVTESMFANPAGVFRQPGGDVLRSLVWNAYPATVRAAVEYVGTLMWPDDPPGIVPA